MNELLLNKAAHLAHIIDKNLNTNPESSNELYNGIGKELELILDKMNIQQNDTTEELVWINSILEELKSGVPAEENSTEDKISLDIMDVIRNRRSIRKWKDQEVENEVIEKLVEAARWAPSSGNRQSVRIIALTKKEYRNLAVDLKEKFLANAPTILVIAYDKRVYNSFELNAGIGLLDSSAVIQNILLYGHSLGLGSVWCKFCVDDWMKNPKLFLEFKKCLNLPAYIELVSLIGIGWIQRIPRTPPRKNISHFLRYNNEGFIEDGSFEEWKAPNEAKSAFSNIKSRLKKHIKVCFKSLKKLFPKAYSLYFNFLVNRNYFKSQKQFKGKKKIVYTLTTPPEHTNIGDQAQVFAIRKWMEETFPRIPVMEVDKQSCIDRITVLKRLISKEDLIIIHSGGNLGDRFMWSETGRRNIVKNFPKNKIIQLPQTIFFHDSELGKKELNKSKEIYNHHNDFTIIGRDYQSHKIGNELFPNKVKFVIPDFVLYLDEYFKINNNLKKDSVLFCLRKDEECNITEKDREVLFRNINAEYEEFDTTYDHYIYADARKNEIKNLLIYFNQFEVIITDRFHGLIFSTLLRKPTIVLPTVDHKLTSAIDWFKELSNVRLIKTEDFPDIEAIREEVLSINVKDGIKWREKHFDGLVDKLGIANFFSKNT